jgi:hypothetical protein
LPEGALAQHPLDELLIVGGEPGFQGQQKDSHPRHDGEEAQVNDLVVVRGRIKNSRHLLPVGRNEPEEDFVDPDTQVVEQAAEGEVAEFLEVAKDLQVLHFQLTDLLEGDPQQQQ